MTLPHSEQFGLTLQFVEGSLTLAGLLLAVGLPRAGAAKFQAIERFFAGIARKKHQSVLLVGLSVIVLRLALLPLLPIPLPFETDDFSLFLAADTFLHGRITNATPAMWTHFETIHVTMVPTYNSMYFPAIGLLLALSKAVFGHPWFGILVVTALMCAAICWMLQEWVPPQWALLGGLLAVLHLGLFSYWVNSYSGGGSIAGLGGALILGALPRILRKVHFRHLLLTAMGVVLVGFTRPYEGTLLCLPVVVRSGIWLVRGKNLPPRFTLLKMASLPLALIVGAVGWLGYYDYRNFGKATTLPYTVNRATYAIAPYFIWQKPRPEPLYRQALMRGFYRKEFEGLLPNEPLWDAPLTALRRHVLDIVRTVYFFSGLALLPLLLFLPRALLDRRIRFLVVCLAFLFAGSCVEVFVLPHYVAPFTGAIYALGIEAARHLWVWNKGGGVGRALIRNGFVALLGLALMRPFDRLLYCPVQYWPSSNWLMLWYGPDHFGTSRESVENELSALPGRQLAIVRYSASHEVFDQWVYNGADIDGQKVIWADDMGADGNRELIQYYKDRKVWLVQPDTGPVSVTPYPTGETIAANARSAGPRP